MTLKLSHKIRNLSAVSILMVLYIHMYYTEGANMPLLNMVEHTVGYGLCSVAVPLFFIISGYLFFLKVPDGLRSITEKLKKRCRTLLIPYLIANILTFVFYISLDVLADMIPAIGSVLNTRVIPEIQEKGVFFALNLIFINPPIAFQLWFIRDLMVVLLLSPLMYLLMKRVSTARNGWLIPVALSVLYCLSSDDYVEAFVWFYIGGYIAMRRINVERFQKPGLAIGAGIIYLALSICSGFQNLSEWSMRVIPVIGIPALWMAYDLVSEKNKTKKIKPFLTGYTFFVYLIHEPLLNIFKKIPLLIDRSEPMLIACYLLIPPIFYVSGCSLGYVLKRWIPRAYSLYTGGR